MFSVDARASRYQDRSSMIAFNAARNRHPERLLSLGEEADLVVPKMIEQIDNAFTRVVNRVGRVEQPGILFPNNNITFTRGLEPWSLSYPHCRIIQYCDPKSGVFTNLILYKPQVIVPPQGRLLLRLETNSGEPKAPNKLIGEVVRLPGKTEVRGKANLVHQAKKFLDKALAVE